MPSSRCIAVLFDAQLDLATEVHRGVVDYLDQHTDWQVLPLPAAQEDRLPELLRGGMVDGVIGSFVSDSWAAALGPVPRVNTSSLSTIRSIDSVVVDDHAIGRLAAEHFLSNGLRSLGYVGLGGCVYSAARLDGFLAALGGSAGVDGAGVARLTWLPQRLHELDDWLAGLARPAGVFCASDLVARAVVQSCRRLGLSVPSAVAVVGVGDSYLDAVFAGIPLSTVPLPGRRLGAAAAELLAARLAGYRGPVRRVVVAPTCLLSRSSSSVVHGTDEVVSGCLAYIQGHLHEWLRVDALARRFSVSRRTLEMRFQAALGRSPAGEIRRRRLDLARQLLRDGSLPIREVGRRCGYLEPQQFSAFFRTQMGLAPRQYRQQAAPEP